MDQDKLRYIWGALSIETTTNMVRKVRSVSKYGDYASWGITHDVREILVKASDEWVEDSMPNWEGMRFSLEKIKLDEIGQYLVLELLDDELEIPFACFCADVIEALADVTPNDRAKKLSAVIYIWDQFFSYSRDKTLSEKVQRGLFAELYWLYKLIIVGKISDVDAVESWKGPQRKMHDFEHRGKVVEVKSTITKEPRKIVISNERQLDDSKLNSLHLFVLTLDVHETGETLPHLVNKIGKHLGKSATSAKFKRKLLQSKYLESDAQKYASCYTVRHEELFNVQRGFPRIIHLPDGVGDLKHSVQIYACKPFQCDMEEYLGEQN